MSTPIDATQFPYNKAKAKAPGACTAADLAAFSAYYKAHSADTGVDATAWGTSVSAACSSCIFTDASVNPSADWGPVVVTDGQLKTVNTGGCVELVSGKPDCGRAYQQYGDCTLEACLEKCTTQSDFAACRQDAAVLTGACKGAIDAVTSACGASVASYETACRGTTYTFEGPIKVACINP